MHYISCLKPEKKNLRHEKDVELECKATSLKEKQHLEGLL